MELPWYGNIPVKVSNMDRSTIRYVSIMLEHSLLNETNILSTESRGYSDMKNCSFFKNNGTQLEPLF